MPPSSVPRAEVVGSLLQPDALLEARRSASPAELTAIEDGAVLDAIRLQEEAGVDVITDGEMRRTAWADTYRHLGGLEPRQVARSYPANPGAGGGTAAGGGPVLRGASAPVGNDRERRRQAQGFPTVVGKIRPKPGESVGSEFGFLRDHAHTRTKYTMAAPSYHRRYWSDTIGRDSGYDSCEEFLTDVRDWQRQVAQRLMAAGCHYLQLDAPNYGSLCDEDNVAWHRAQGHDTSVELAFDAQLDSSVCEGLDLTSALHICRGNLPGGAWHSGGGYAAIADQVFPHLGFDVVLLEYDSDRAGDFRPLELLPEGTMAVLGLLTTKAPALEGLDDLEARVEEATKYHPTEALAVSTQCGFASAANAPMTVAEEQAKLRRVAELARRVWS